MIFWRNTPSPKNKRKPFAKPQATIYTQPTMANKIRPAVVPLTVPDAKALLPFDLSDLKLNLREYKFVAAYTSNGFRAGPAAEAAGFSGRNPAQYTATGQEVLKRPQVNEAIRRFIDLVLGPYKAKLEYEVLDRYYRRATYDVTTFYDEELRPRPLDEIPSEWRQCIDAVEVKFDGPNKAIKMAVYKLPDRDAALQLLYKFATGIDPKNAQQDTAPPEARAKLETILRKHSNGDISLTMQAATKHQPTSKRKETE